MHIVRVNKNEENSTTGMLNKIFLIACAVIIYFFSLQSHALTDGFERGSFEKNWVRFGDTLWGITTNQVRQGRFSARAFSSKNRRTNSILQTATNVRFGGRISFFLRTETRSSLNRLNFYIDGRRMLSVSRTTSWRKYSYRLSKGSHILRWEFEGGSSASNGKAWVDNIKGPAEDFSLFSDISYNEACTKVINDIWAGDFKGPINNLSKKNFSWLAKDKRLQNFNFTKLGNAKKINASLVMDYSGSMSNDDIRNAESAAIEYVRLMDANDVTGIIKFSTSVKTIRAPVSNRNLLYQSINKEHSNFGSTALYDGIIRGIAQIRNRSRPKVVLVYTDGMENNSRADIEDVINAARNNNVNVYTVGLGNNIDEVDLRRIADETGGEYNRSPTSAKLLEVYSRLRGNLSGNYRLTASIPTELKFGGIEFKTIANSSGIKSQSFETGKGCLSLVPIYQMLLLQ